jgi:uncharacterized protein (TIGR02594 family)
VNFICKQAGLMRTGSAAARSWLEWGVGLDVPPYGCITVLQRGRGPQPGPEVVDAPGHVGFFLGMANEMDILLLGGNQSNSVNVSLYPKHRVLSHRWPG